MTESSLKDSGFLQVPRKEAGYRSAKERVSDFKAVERQMNEEEIVSQSARCMDCGVPFCHGYGCPLSNVVPEWNDLVFRKKWKQALALLLSTSPFPEFTARLCPALCEASCVLGLTSDPVSIRQIELFVIEKGFQEGWVKPRIPLERKEKKVAVIGSGPAGLAAADELNRRGYSVRVYESDTRPGGLLRYGIPDFKLEKWVIDRRIKIMEEEGVVFETGVHVGADLSAGYLMQKYKSICLTGGARQPRDLPLPGRELEGIHFALELLGEQNRINAGEIPADKAAITLEGKQVVVIGGGDTGSDCIGTTIRRGAAGVTQLEIMPKPSETRTEVTPWPEWPVILRTSSSHKEGCERRWSVSTVRFTGENNRVSGLDCIEVEWEIDSNGKPVKFSPKPGSEFHLPADVIMLAMGFTGPVQGPLFQQFGVKLSERGLVEKDDHGMTSVPGVFTAGDMTKGASLIVRAIADGMETAVRMDQYLEGKEG